MTTVQWVSKKLLEARELIFPWRAWFFCKDSMDKSDALQQWCTYTSASTPGLLNQQVQAGIAYRCSVWASHQDAYHCRLRSDIGIELENLSEGTLETVECISLESYSFFFWDKVSLCSPDWPELDRYNRLASNSQLYPLPKVCTTTHPVIHSHSKRNHTGLARPSQCKLRETQVLQIYSSRH